jgi:hypothetical protein
MALGPARKGGTWGLRHAPLVLPTAPSAPLVPSKPGALRHIIVSPRTFEKSLLVPISLNESAPYICSRSLHCYTYYRCGHSGIEILPSELRTAPAG